MKYIKIAGAIWGFIYFVIGAKFSFTLGGIDFWSGVTVLLALFLFPLPISIVAVWLPKIAGRALIVCAAVSITTSVVTVTSQGNAPNLAGLCKFVMFNVPHLVFALAYINAGQASKNSDPEDGKPSVGLA
ncbi:MAG: hypothetical protein WAL75_10345 [Terracidiphilus sp.]